MDGDDSAGFGAQLRTCRAAARLSQQDLADRSGLSIRAIRNMERGRTQWPYRDSLVRLADALGLEEPDRAEFLACVPRRRLALRSLTADQAPADPGPGSYATGNGNRVIPRQLPTSARPFTGRATELTVLDQLLSHSGPDEPGTAIISAIGGTAGVGKTALALRWAHQVADRFPDGQLYVNLRGYDTGEPVRAETVQASFLRAMGMPGPDIPAGAEERSAAYRSLLAGRKMLIVLDNACRVDQVRPLLPAGPSCVTLVTSRDSLAGLIARDGAIPVVLDLLPLTDAVRLLTELIGDRAAADPDATARLAICCCRLPLALRVAAELVTAHPQDPLAELAAELASWQRSLDLLEAGGDDRTAIREVFSWSVRHLKPGTACAFALAALHPGTDLDAWALAAMAGTGYLQADRMLRELARAHLVQPAGDSRYGMHDLLRAFGRELCAADDGMIDTDAAAAGLLCYLQRGAAAAMDILHPADAGRRPRPAGPAAGLPSATGEQQARTWLDTERETLIAAIGYAADHGRPMDAVNLADIIARYLDLGGFFTEAITVHSSAIRAARLAGDPRAEAGALLNLADIRVRRSQYEDALGCYQRARDLGRLAGDQLAGHRELNGLARINRLQGRYLQAAGYYQQILDLGRSSGNQHQQVVGLIGLGTTGIFTGQYQQATRWLEDAVGIAGTIGEQILRAAALLNMGNLRILQCRYQQAADHLQECRAICTDAGDQVIAAYALCHLVQADVRRGLYRQPESEAQLREVLTRFGNSGNQNAQILALFCLGELQLRFGRYREAHESLERAIAICDKTGALQERAETLTLLGEVFLATGEPAKARARLTDALALASQIGDLLQEAHAHRGLANAETALGNEVNGRWHREQALARYTELGIPEAGRLSGSPAGEPVPFCLKRIELNLLLLGARCRSGSCHFVYRVDGAQVQLASARSDESRAAAPSSWVTKEEKIMQDMTELPALDPFVPEPAAAADRSRWVALVVLCLGMLMIVLDVTIVNVALPSIQASLGFSQSGLAWVVNAYLIAFGGLLLLAGRIGDLTGRRNVFVAGLALFTIASLVCGMSMSQSMLIGARFVQGVGGAMTSAVILGMIVTLFPEPREMAKAIGVYAFVASAGGAVGLLAGGILTQAINWHWIFFVNLPIGIATAAFALRVIPQDAIPGRRKGTRPGEGTGSRRSVDVAGAVLITSAMMLSVFTIVKPASENGWLAARTLTFGAVSVALLVGFVVREMTARNPLMPLRILRSRNITGANIIQVLSVAGMFGTFFLGSLYLREVNGYDPLRIGLAFLPVTVGMAVLSVRYTDRIAAKMGARPTMIAGLALITASLVLFAQAPVHGGYLEYVFPVTLLLGIGAGLAFPTLMTTAMSGVAQTDAGLASGLINTTAQVGGALGLAILATVSAGRTSTLSAHGASTLAALTGGYHLAFWIAAGLAAASIPVAAVLRPASQGSAG